MIYGLFVGIEKYLHGLPPVRFAEKDAREVREAFVAQGLEVGNLILLLQTATCATIENSVKKIYEAAGPDDTVILFYAGHGLLEHGRTFLSAVDTSLDNIGGTAVSLEDIALYVKASRCLRSMMFLDACHSGVELSENVRDTIGHLSDEQLKKFFESANYRVGFASCRSDQKSYTSIPLQNGVWSHFLIRALRGDVAEILQGGILTSTALQDYLAQNVPRRVVEENGAFSHQNPHIFGLFSNTFQVANLTEILRAKAAENQSASIGLMDLHMRGSSEISITSLSGWRKGHGAPRDTPSGRNFFAQLCRDDLNEWSEKIYQGLKAAFAYKMNDIRVEKLGSNATIVTKDFTLDLFYEQTEEGSEDVERSYDLHSISNPDALQNSGLNALLREKLDTVVLSFQKSLNIKKVIQAAEAEGELRCTYPSNFEYTTITKAGCTTSATFHPDEVQLVFRDWMGPAKLLVAFRADTALLGTSPTIGGLLK